jgi:hypothetical protein
LYIKKLSGICREEDPFSIIVWCQERGHEEGEKRKGWYCMRGGEEKSAGACSLLHMIGQKRRVWTYIPDIMKEGRREEDRIWDQKQLAHICCETISGRMSGKHDIREHFSQLLLI